MIILPILTTSPIHFFWKGWENIFCDLRSGRVKLLSGTQTLLVSQACDVTAYNLDVLYFPVQETRGGNEKVCWVFHIEGCWNGPLPKPMVTGPEHRIIIITVPGCTDSKTGRFRSWDVTFTQFDCSDSSGLFRFPCSPSPLPPPRCRCRIFWWVWRVQPMGVNSSLLQRLLSNWSGPVEIRKSTPPRVILSISFQLIDTILLQPRFDSITVFPRGLPHVYKVPVCGQGVLAAAERALGLL